MIILVISIDFYRLNHWRSPNSISSWCYQLTRLLIGLIGRLKLLDWLCVWGCILAMHPVLLRKQTHHNPDKDKAGFIKSLKCGFPS